MTAQASPYTAVVCLHGETTPSEIIYKIEIEWNFRHNWNAY